MSTHKQRMSRPMPNNRLDEVDEGRQAYSDGRSVYTVPYPCGSFDREYWEQGWYLAYYAAQDCAARQEAWAEVKPCVDCGEDATCVHNSEFRRTVRPR